MLLTISTTSTDPVEHPATDFGYLLMKHPDRVSEFPQSFGTAWVFFPEATAERCTVALLLEIDPIQLTKAATRRTGRNSGPTAAVSDASLAQYVNDRPYAASSLLSVALGRVFSTARSGTSSARPELAAQPIPLEIEIPVLPSRGDPELVQRLFAPLGWQVDAEQIPLDDRFPDWGPSPYLHVRLTGNLRLADALNQLYLLLPVLDASKHYWQSDDEVEKLVRSGSDWLRTHPERELITRSYLAKSFDLTKSALARLAELDDETPDSIGNDDEPSSVECESSSAPPHQFVARIDGDPGIECAAGVYRDPEPPVPLRIQRQEAVLAELKQLAPATVLDLGCGSGALLARLLADSAYRKIVGTDVSMRALRAAAKKLHLEEASERQAQRIELLQSSLTYEDPRLAGFDAAVLMEVIEHIDLSRLPALERTVFGAAAPKAIIVTTPNAEFNAKYPGLHGGDQDGRRHSDHRFEWTRREFADWARRVGDEFGYQVEFSGIGDTDAELGAPTQLAVFTKEEPSKRVAA